MVMLKRNIALALSSLLLASTAAFAAIVTVTDDGGFESGSPNAFWDEASTNFGTPLCTVADCGTGTGTGPRSGTWWAWFGGIGAAETGHLYQDVVIPSGTATLSFWLEARVSSGNPADFLAVSIHSTDRSERRDAGFVFQVRRVDSIRERAGSACACGVRTSRRKNADKCPWHVS